jgi:hypothetical protein
LWPAKGEPAGEKDTAGSSVDFVRLSLVPLGRGELFICLIALTIMTPISKTEKPTGVFWYAFLAEKCILRSFLGTPVKLGSQHTRHEPFTNDAKMGHLYDKSAFASAPASDDFPRNLLKINQIALKSARPVRGQNRVTYNNMPSAKPEKQSPFCVDR